LRSGEGVVGAGQVLVVSADDDIGRLVGRTFERLGYATSSVASGEEALATTSRARPALVVLDLELEDITGYEVCYELRERSGEDLPIILVSGARTEPSDRVAGLLIGADEYLMKPLDPDELVARARRLLSRTPVPSLAMDAPLTGREVQVLQLLANGLPQDAIAKELFISSKTVATHIQRIITKLGVHSRTEAVAIAYREGLVGDLPPTGGQTTRPAASERP
jgi:DNA-binding NarL/FixJ family response regulator